MTLKPFESTIARRGTTEAEAIEMIDIGGPAMVRAAAKNFAGVGVVVDPDDYAAVAAALGSDAGELPLALRRRLAAKAFAHTAGYDAAICGYLSSDRAAPGRLDDGRPGRA